VGGLNSTGQSWPSKVKTLACAHHVTPLLLLLHLLLGAPFPKALNSLSNLQLYNLTAADELERLEKAFDVVKKQLFGRLHDIARKQLFPSPVPQEQQPQQPTPLANGSAKPSASSRNGSSSDSGSVRSASSSSSSSMCSLDGVAAAAVSLVNGGAKGKAAGGGAAVGGDYTLVDKEGAKGGQ
jgi:hypothetical protein